MQRIAEETARITCDNKNVAFVERERDDGKIKLQVLGMNTNSEEKTRFTITYRTGNGTTMQSGEVNSTEIVEIDLQ